VSENPFKSRPPVETLVLAEALRAHNVRHNPTSWESTTSQAQKLWIERAREVNEQIRKATERRRTA
jgi:hypothetical protein